MGKMSAFTRPLEQIRRIKLDCLLVWATIGPQAGRA
jgi:hypothetical protein